MNQFVIRGTRGTLPVCGTDFLRYGGDTTCFSIETPEGLLIIDAGSGLRHVTQELMTRTPLPSITVLLTHLHMDHLIGLPSFGPLYSSHASIRFLADPGREEDWERALLAFMRKPYWPVGLSDADATLEFGILSPPPDPMDIYGIRVRWCQVPHPQQCTAYRLDWAGDSVVVATDIELDAAALPEAFIRFCEGAGHLIFDAHFTPQEIAGYSGWGHSTWKTGVALAAAADVGELLLTHHAPRRTDAEIDRIVEDARRIFSPTHGATTNLTLTPLP